MRFEIQGSKVSHLGMVKICQIAEGLTQLTHELLNHTILESQLRHCGIVQNPNPLLLQWRGGELNHPSLNITR